MMSSVLVFTDTPARGERLARELNALAPCLVVDLLDPEHRGLCPPAASLRAVVSDASLTSSATIAALRFQLDRLKPSRIPYLCLLHQDTPRTRLQATALGATSILRADSLGRELLGTLSKLTSSAASLSAGVQASAAAADAVLARIFDLGRSNAAVKPELIAAGTEFVEQAVREAGISEWLEVVWRFDDATHQHCLLVAGLAAGFARFLGLREADCQRLTQAAVLHDIGKAKIPSRILNKPGPLSPDERAIMNQHPVYGHSMLLGSGFPDEMLAVVRSHHECLDGSGYPDGLNAKQIPDLVRLVTVCDIYSALIERRPYRTPMSAEQAYSALESMVGKLDGDLVRAFQPFTRTTAPAPLRASA
ncbi:putative nucleotidyltransferase with HDIG domain [Methylobacterium sp. BE186]|uniref:HD-GYP domain-containing protein n=1 Tax=Methylobacterium sp. BE186 TaxID=2817715 RepID=UPI0028575229|nr:HD-GYP domain-containing protein [Methylobacterium sp. BE186]MDR7040384.1 putative nucleotidyltransferase with HDIG domain [Methylobacterium sp. BE186]